VAYDLHSDGINGSGCQFSAALWREKTLVIAKLLLAFILVPLAEFLLLVWVTKQTSVLWTIGLVVATGILGTLLARSQAIHTLRRFRETAARGMLPSEEIQEGLLIVFAAALLLTPGLITDSMGLLLLIPATRRYTREFLVGRLFNNFRSIYVQVPHPTAGATGDRSDETRYPEHDSPATPYRTVDATSWSTGESSTTT